MKNKFIALTDLETSGDIPGLHEILEIGLVVFDPATFEIKDTYNQKVKPKNIQTAIPEALELNGYNENDWRDAISLEDAILEYSKKVQNCVFCAYNVSFDWAFILKAFYDIGILNPMSTRENHDRIDLLSIAYDRGLKNGKSLSLKTACELFGVPPEPPTHSALNGAMTAYDLFKKFYKS